MSGWEHGVNARYVVDASFPILGPGLFQIRHRLSADHLNTAGSRGLSVP